MTRSHDARRPPLPQGLAGHEIEVIEKNTDTSWALFQALQEQQELGFEKTRPQTLQEQRQARGAGALTVEDVMLEARRNNRVCPTPAVWQRLHAFLPNKTPELPPVPGTRAEWDQLSPLEKRSRLRLHVEWAWAQGVLPHVHRALKALPENRWHHMGE